MRSFLFLLLISALALTPVGCKRDEGTDESVSANAARADEQATEQVEPKRQTPPRETATRPAPLAPRQEARRVEKQAPAPARERQAEREPEPEPVRVQTARVPAGTEVTVVLADAIGTEFSQEGDSFTANLAAPIIVNGKMVADKGSRVSGRVETVEEPGKVKGRAKLELVLTNLTAGGRNYRLSTEPFVAVGEGSKDRDAATIGGGAAVGAAIGAVTGGKKGAAIGAAAGAGAGTTAVLLTKGKQLRLDPETRVNFILSDDVTMPVLRAPIS